MALGKVDVAVGTDLSELYCQPEAKSTARGVQFIKWTSIELLHNVRNNLTASDRRPKITYRAKVKLHGTNAAVQVTTAGEVAAQKRTGVLWVFDPLNDPFKKRSQVITPQNDNAGFADWVSHNLDYFGQLKGDRNLTIFGEWCGSNIQKGVAIAQIERKVLAVFAVQYGGVDRQITKLEIRPEKIREILPQHADIFVLPYYGEPVTLDFGDKEALQRATEQINSIVASVEAVDPWVKENFAVEGTGEGLVMYPETDKVVLRQAYTELIFKAKGEKHRVVKNKQAVQIDPEVAESIEEFVNLFVTKARLEQALTEGCNGVLDMRQMGQFLKWISLDIQQESIAELAAANLTWKQVNKSLSTAARQWYEQQVKQ
ncbi:MAG: RNA ligase family protein [Cyanobacteria bacterium J06623_7]